MDVAPTLIMAVCADLTPRCYAHTCMTYLRVRIQCLGTRGFALASMGFQTSALYNKAKAASMTGNRAEGSLGLRNFLIHKHDSRRYA
jgi:hypothetical protein